MTKLKNALLLLLVALLIGAGAVLPTAVARVQSSLTEGTVEYTQMDSVKLTLKEEKEILDMLQKMNLVCNGMGVEVTSEVTRMNGKDILETMYTQLLPYSEYGLFVELDNDYLEFYPVMVYDEKDPDIYNFYWYVNVSFDVSEDDYLTVILDDDTGKILALEYVDPNMYIEKESLWEFQDGISAVYFENLGLTPVEAMPVDTEGTISETMGTVDGAGDSHVMVSYRFDGVNAGEVQVEIGVHTNGFGIYLTA